jgi:signal peptidase I
LIINEISYRFEAPERGEIVVFKYPKDTSQYFIKRIIGLPNETVEIRENKVIVYNNDNPNGITLDEKYLDEGVETLGNKTLALGVDEYFAMGDNRIASYDSRSFGPINKSHIVGKVWVRGWPFDKIKIFETPEYK